MLSCSSAEQSATPCTSQLQNTTGPHIETSLLYCVYFWFRKKIWANWEIYTKCAYIKAIIVMQCVIKIDKITLYSLKLKLYNDYAARLKENIFEMHYSSLYCFEKTLHEDIMQMAVYLPKKQIIIIISYTRGYLVSYYIYVMTNVLLLYLCVSYIHFNLCEQISSVRVIWPLRHYTRHVACVAVGDRLGHHTMI